MCVRVCVCVCVRARAQQMQQQIRAAAHEASQSFQRLRQRRLLTDPDFWRLRRGAGSSELVLPQETGGGEGSEGRLEGDGQRGQGPERSQGPLGSVGEQASGLGERTSDRLAKLRERASDRLASEPQTSDQLAKLGERASDQKRGIVSKRSEGNKGEGMGGKAADEGRAEMGGARPRFRLRSGGGPPNAGWCLSLGFRV